MRDSVTVGAGASYDPDVGGAIADYEWSLGQPVGFEAAALEGSGGPVVKVHGVAPGTATLVLTVTDADGAATSVATTVHVFRTAAALAAYTATVVLPPAACVGLACAPWAVALVVVAVVMVAAAALAGLCSGGSGRAGGKVIPVVEKEAFVEAEDENLAAFVAGGADKELFTEPEEISGGGGGGGGGGDMFGVVVPLGGLTRTANDLTLPAAAAVVVASVNNERPGSAPR